LYEQLQHATSCGLFRTSVCGLSETRILYSCSFSNQPACIKCQRTASASFAFNCCNFPTCSFTAAAWAAFSEASTDWLFNALTLSAWAATSFLISSNYTVNNKITLAYRLCSSLNLCFLRRWGCCRHFQPGCIKDNCLPPQAWQASCTCTAFAKLSVHARGRYETFLNPYPPPPCSDQLGHEIALVIYYLFIYLYVILVIATGINTVPSIQ